MQNHELPLEIIKPTKINPVILAKFCIFEFKLFHMDGSNQFWLLFLKCCWLFLNIATVSTELVNRMHSVCCDDELK